MARGICPGDQRLGGGACGVALEGGPGWRERWWGGALMLAAPTERGDRVGERCGTFLVPHPLRFQSPQKPLRPPCLCLPSLSVSSRWPASLEDPYVKAPWKLKRRAPPGNGGY